MHTYIHHMCIYIYIYIEREMLLSYSGNCVRARVPLFATRHRGYVGDRIVLLSLLLLSLSLLLVLLLVAV